MRPSNILKACVTEKYQSCEGTKKDLVKKILSMRSWNKAHCPVSELKEKTLKLLYLLSLILILS